MNEMDQAVQDNQQINKKDKLKLKKKRKRQQKRIELAKEKALLETDVLYQTQKEVEEELSRIQEEQEQQKRDLEYKLWLEREEQIKKEWEEKQKQDLLIQERKKKEEEERERKKQILQEQLLKDITISTQSVPQEVHATSISTTPTASAANNAAIQNNNHYSINKDIPNCGFYMNTGSCKYGDRCEKYHPYPSVSTTVLIKNMYDGLGLQNKVIDEDDILQYDETEAYQHYKQFYADVISEFESYGEIIQFKVCCNYAPHLRGNVYVQFKEESAAVSAFNALNGRWYASKQLTPEFSPVTQWKRAVCGLYSRKLCPKGKECNFLHVFP